jgi:type I restriction enzyme M protein
MNPSSSVSEIETILWNAYDVIHGRIYPWEWREGLALFLLKYLSDNPGSDGVVIPRDCDFDFLYRSQGKAQLALRIAQALQKIEETNTRKLKGVLTSSSSAASSEPGLLKDDEFRVFLESLARLDLRHVNGVSPASEVFDRLLARFAEAGHRVGSFYTPSDVASLLTELVPLEPGDRIYDPSCGSGSLLLEAWKKLHPGTSTLSGQEMDPTSLALCRLNLLLNGAEAQIELGDVLDSPLFFEGGQLSKFDVILTNPPFGLKWRPSTGAGSKNDPWDRFHRGDPPKTSADYAFLSHVVESLSQNGRGAILVPQGVLFRSGPEGVIREKLVEEGLIAAAISLPANLFYGTSIPVAVLLLQKGREDRDILFIDASNGYSTKRTRSYLRAEDITRIADAARVFESIPGFAYRAKLGEVSGQNFNLSVARYVSPCLAPKSSIEELRSEITTLERELAIVQSELSACLQELGYEDR